MENYYLVKVKKPFGIYSVGAELTMREKLFKGIYKDKVAEIKKLSADELAKYNPQIKYRVEKIETEGAEKSTEVEGNIIEQDGEPETEGAEIIEGSENSETTDIIENSETDTEVELEELATEELLKLANETYKLNKPSNTGRPNLIASITEARKN